MRRRDEIVVGVTVLITLTVIVLGAVWLGQTRFGQGGFLRTARFETVGGLSVGNPVVFRGVRVGRIQAITLGAEDWVEASLEIYEDIDLPEMPAVIAASASLFGEWQAGIVAFDDDLGDPNVRRALDRAAATGDDAWPGATLPDIGQLTAQAGRIASDIASFSARIETAFDDEAVLNLQRSIRDFSQTADQINTFAGTQTEVLGQVAEEVRATTGIVSETARYLESTMARIDSATANGRLDTLMINVGNLTTDMQQAVGDFQSIIGVVFDRRESLARIMGGADTVFTRLQDGSGTIGRLVSDSTLYVEASQAIAELRELLADIKENPRKYFKFSVF